MKLFLISVSLLACFLFAGALGYHGGRHDRNNGGRGGNDGGSDGNESRRYGGRRGKHNGQSCIMKCRDRCSSFESCLGQCENNCAEGEDPSRCRWNCISNCSSDESSDFPQCATCVSRTRCGKRIAACRAANCKSNCTGNTSVKQLLANTGCKECVDSNCAREIGQAMGEVIPGNEDEQGENREGRRSKHHGQRCLMTCNTQCSELQLCMGQCQGRCSEGQHDSTCASNCIDACTADESNRVGACQGCILRTPCGKRIVKCRVKYCGNLCPMNVSVSEIRSNLACKQCMDSNCSHEILNVISKQKPRRMDCFAQCEPQCSDFKPCMRQCSRPCLEGQDDNQQQCFSNCIDTCSTDENSRFGVCEGCMVETPCGQSISTCRAENCETSCPNDLLTPSQMRQNPTCKQCMEINCSSEMMQPMNELIHRPVGCFAQCRSRCVSGKTCTEASEGNCTTGSSSAQCARDCVSSCRANEANNS